jgi:hypothetical protein
MKTLATSLTLGAVIAASMLTQTANAQQSDHRIEDRPAIIHECMVMNKRFNTDPYSAAGGVQHMYGACMANHGQPR